MRARTRRLHHSTARSASTSAWTARASASGAAAGGGRPAPGVNAPRRIAPSASRASSAVRTHVVGEPELGGERGRRHRAAVIEVGADRAPRRGLGVGDVGPRRRREVGGGDGAGDQHAGRAEALGRDPGGRVVPAGGGPGQPGRAAARGQAVEPAGRLGGERSRRGLGHQPQRHQRVVELVRIPDRRRDLVGDRRDRRGIEGAGVGRHLGRGRAPQVDRARPPLLERGVVEERVGVGVDQLVAQRRRLDRVAGQDPDLAALDALEQRAQAGDIHRLDHAVADGLEHQRVVGDLAVAGDVLEAGLGLREHHRQQVGGAHAQQVRRRPSCRRGGGARSATG